MRSPVIRFQDKPEGLMSAHSVLSQLIRQTTLSDPFRGAVSTKGLTSSPVLRMLPVTIKWASN
jgi:hypothetical protein